jgi:hypothetical protein
LNEATGLYVEKQEKIIEAQETFNKIVDKHGSKIIVDAFKDFLKSI